MLTFVHRLVCGIRGHQIITKPTPKRLEGECLECGYKTPGWTLSEYSSDECQQMFDEMMDVEMNLHPGG